MEKKKTGTGSRRRYKIGLHPIYDKRFDDLRLNSIIFNSRRKMEDISRAILDLNDPLVLRNLLAEWQGNDEGKYRKGERMTASSKLLLRNGPRGSGRLKDGFLTILDGQSVDFDSTGKVLIISDERSPYFRMSTADYYKLISDPWRKAKEKLEGKKWKLQQRLHTTSDIHLLQPQWKTLRAKLLPKRKSRANNTPGMAMTRDTAIAVAID